VPILIKEVTISHEPFDNYRSSPIILSSKNKDVNIGLKTSGISM
jgi:hypothetical protein